jgi:CHAD domain-containing protein
MSFALKWEETVPKAIRRVGRNRIDKSLQALAATPGRESVSDEAIHQTRKRLKQVRAALRLARGEFARKEFRREDRSLRDAGRPLSRLRDAKVTLETFGALTKEGTPHLSSNSTARVHAVLSARRKEVRRKTLKDARSLRAIKRALDKASRRVARWSFKHPGWKALEPGLRRIYARGRDALAAATRDGSDEALHQLRKRGKDLRYSLELLSRVEPATIGCLARTAHRFTDCLGKDHDLAVLQALLEGELRAKVSGLALQQLRKPVSSKRASLQTAALEMGDRLYKEDEDAFIQRMHAHWKAWRRSPRRH